MFDEVRIPKKLGKSPIKKAVIEIRYDGDVIEAALYGLLMDVFSKFGKQNVQQTPFFQLPQEIREKDPALKYQVVLQGIKDTEYKGKFVFGIGAHIIQFSIVDVYSTWSDWTKLFESILAEIRNKKIITKTEQIRLHYYDVFDGNIFPHLHASVHLEEKKITDPPVSFRTRFLKGNVEVVLNVGNTVNINGTERKNSSLIDIECLHELSGTEIFFDVYEKILAEEHTVNKEVFFGLLDQELLASLEPVYD
jgi:uncharacterized protein (TIGR04255 family)